MAIFELCHSTVFSEQSILAYQVTKGHNVLWELVSEYDRFYLLNYEYNQRDATI
jgi:hypothetical protein